MSGFDSRFEMDVLAGAAKDHGYRRRVIRIVEDVECWSSEGHRFIWGLIKKLGEGDVLSGPIVKKAADRLREDDYEEALETAKELFRRAPAAKEYAADQLELWIRAARMKRGMQKAVKVLSDGNVDEAEVELIGAVKRKSHTVVEAGDWFMGYDDRQEQRFRERKEPTLRPAIPTRLPSFDKMLSGGGIRIEQIGMVIGHTGRGKSMVANHFAFYGASAGWDTIEFCTEMSKELVDTRLDAKFFERSIKDFENFDFTPTDLADLDDKWCRLEARLANRLYTVSVPPKWMTPAALEEVIDEREQETGRKTKLVVVDSPDHMIPDERGIREARLQASSIYWSLKRIVTERKMAMWVTCQGPAAWLDRLMTAEAFSESYDKTRTADIVFTMNQTKAEKRTGLIRGYVAKNRTGSAGDLIYLSTDLSRAHIEETEPPIRISRKTV